MLVWCEKIKAVRLDPVGKSRRVVEVVCGCWFGGGWGPGNPAARQGFQRSAASGLRKKKHFKKKVPT